MSSPSAEGRLSRVFVARNQAEAELIQGLLLENGIPSILKRSAGFDVPDYLASGPRDVLVSEKDFSVGRALLPETSTDPFPKPNPARILIGIAIGLAIVAAIAWLAT